MNSRESSSSSFEAFVNQDMLEQPSEIRSKSFRGKKELTLTTECSCLVESPPSWNSNHIDEASWNAFCILASSNSMLSNDNFHVENQISPSFMIGEEVSYLTEFGSKSREYIRSSFKKTAPGLKIAPNPNPSVSEIYVPVSNVLSPVIKVERITPSLDQNLKPSLNLILEPDLARQNALVKRQERLIKNRAAALQSRKRKREQMLFLESENLRLSKENITFKNRIQELESKLISPVELNLDLQYKAAGNLVSF